MWECSKEIISSFHHFVVRSAHRNTWIGNQSRGRGCVLPHNLTASELAERGRGGAVKTQKGLKILLRLIVRLSVSVFLLSDSVWAGLSSCSIPMHGMNI